VFCEFGNAPRGLYDSFSTRNIQLAAQKVMAKRFGGNLDAMRRDSTTELAKTLKVKLDGWSDNEQAAFSNFAYVASMLPEISKWNREDQSKLVDIIRAKAAAEESKYLRLMQQHQSLKQAVVRLGSSRSR